MYLLLIQWLRECTSLAADFAKLFANENINWNTRRRAGTAVGHLGGKSEASDLIEMLSEPLFERVHERIGLALHDMESRNVIDEPMIGRLKEIRTLCASSRETIRADKEPILRVNDARSAHMRTLMRTILGPLTSRSEEHTSELQ